MTFELYTAPEPVALLAQALRRVRSWANSDDKGKNVWLCWLSTGGGFLPHPPAKKAEMFVLGKRRRWKEPPLCLAQPRQEKRLWSRLCEFVQGYWGELYDNTEESVKGRVGRLTTHLWFFMILWSAPTSDARSPALSCLMMGRLHS